VRRDVGGDVAGGLDSSGAVIVSSVDSGEPTADRSRAGVALGEGDVTGEGDARRFRDGVALGDGEIIGEGDGDGVALAAGDGERVGVGVSFFFVADVFRCFRGVGLGFTKKFLIFSPSDSSSAARAGAAAAIAAVITIRTKDRSFFFTPLVFYNQAASSCRTT
jgi:hypothetical protein